MIDSMCFFLCMEKHKKYDKIMIKSYFLLSHRDRRYDHLREDHRMKRNKLKKHHVWYVGGFLICNLIACVLIGQIEYRNIQKHLQEHGVQSQKEVQSVMDDYMHSFRLFANMLTREIEVEPEPAAIWKYLKNIDQQLLDIEGTTYDGLYMYYQGAYLYSWDTPYEQYEKNGYDATTRPWYLDAVKGKGEIVFTPPYMSYANHYILSTISQLQPDQETVFAYDIKMENIQTLVSTLESYDKEQLIIFDKNGTIIGSSNETYLGGNLNQSTEENLQLLEQAKQKLEQADDAMSKEDRSKIQDEVTYAQSFYDFQLDIAQDFNDLVKHPQTIQLVSHEHQHYFGLIQQGKQFDYLILVPVISMLSSTIQTWMIPLLIVEIILIYVLSQISKEIKNRELKNAYIELGQTQKRLEIALQAAQKAAAIDELTGMMNMKSFRSTVKEHILNLEENESGILIMIDGDRFKTVNDQYGHMVGDEVIKLTAQMIVGRIRIVDYASRLHGDEFAIFIANTEDYTVAQKIMQDINESLAKEAQKRNMPTITLSSGAVIAHRYDHYMDLAKTADTALYKAKETHNGAFCSADNL